MIITRWQTDFYIIKLKDEPSGGKRNISYPHAGMGRIAHKVHNPEKIATMDIFEFLFNNH